MTLLMHQGQQAALVMEVLAAEEARQASVQSKVGRNDPCPCGSGLKFKKCHSHRYPAEPEKSLPQRA